MENILERYLKQTESRDCRQCYADDNLLCMTMVCCPRCGNKRCPKAENHRYKCTGSNALNQIPENE